MAAHRGAMSGAGRAAIGADAGVTGKIPHGLRRLRLERSQFQRVSGDKLFRYSRRQCVV